MTSIPVWRGIGQTPLPGREDRDVPIVIVGGGPVGLALAIDLGQRGHRVVVLNRLDVIAAGSKAICYAKHSLEYLDRLGVGDAAVARGVTWNTGKVFWKDKASPIYSFDLLPVRQQKMPAFINLQQYLLEEMLVERLHALPNVALRWGHEVTGIAPGGDGVTLTVNVGSQAYTQRAAWVVACDGSRSTIRQRMGLDFEGRGFEDNFLIADIRLKADLPSERWFWFDPLFNPGRTALLHRQPDDVWRLDFQLGPGIDRAAAIRPEAVDPLVCGLLGAHVAYDRVWYSVYAFQCRRMARFVHDRVLFAGDAAHLVSPFGARGCNGGFADVANLAWKLDRVVGGTAGGALLETYNDEAVAAADENIRHSTRATDFISPGSPGATGLRDAVLALADDTAFARAMVNSGRLFAPARLVGSALNTPDRDDWGSKGVPPGCAAIDAPLGSGWLLAHCGQGFTLLSNGPFDPGLPDLRCLDIQHATIAVERYALPVGGAVLVRPDRLVCARWHAATAADVHRAVATAMNRGP